MFDAQLFDNKRQGNESLYNNLKSLNEIMIVLTVSFIMCSQTLKYVDSRELDFEGETRNSYISWNTYLRRNFRGTIFLMCIDLAKRLVEWPWV